MAQDDTHPNELRVVISKGPPETWHCSYTVDFTTPEGAEILRRIRSPEGVLRWLHAGIANCWLDLPENSRNLAMLRREMRRFMDLTTENLHAHPQAFGIDGGPPDPAAADFWDTRIQGSPAKMMLHAAFKTCYQMPPEAQRSVIEVERETRVLFEQALADVQIGATGFIEWP